jgi:predicted HicB family RNase H-like nuclease
VEFQGQFIKLKKEIRKQAKLLAIESDLSISQWCEKAIEEKINRELKSKGESYKTEVKS